MMYQLGWSTLPGLRGLSCSEFRAMPTASPDNEGGVADALEIAIASLEETAAARRA